MYSDDPGFVIFGIAHTIYTGDRSYDDDIPSPGEQIGRRTQPEFIDFFIDGEVFFNIGIRDGQVSLRLVVVIVGHKIFHRIVWKEFFEFTIELSGKGFVVREYQYRFLHLLDHIGNAEGFA